MKFELFEQLLDTGRIRLCRGRLLETSPAPKPADFDFGRIEGMLLGLAIGDSLGNTTESWFPSRRLAQFGADIRDYLPAKETGLKGLPSDDTQMAFWTVEQLVEDGELLPEKLATIFSSRRIYGIGKSVRGFIERAKEGLPWTACGIESAGNGALMRIAPVLLPHLRTGGRELWVDAALSAMVTHNDFASTASCLAFTRILWEALDLREPPEPQWWLERFVETCSDLEGTRAYEPRGGEFAGYRGPLSRFVRERVSDAHERGLTARQACDAWHSGAFLLETVPSVLYILMRHGHDFEEAIVRAVNDTKDNDSAAAIVGAAVGALHGRGAIPRRWLDGLRGRTRESDDGRVFELIERAKAAFWTP